MIRCFRFIAILLLLTAALGADYFDLVLTRWNWLQERHPEFFSLIHSEHAHSVGILFCVIYLCAFAVRLYRRRITVVNVKNPAPVWTRQDFRMVCLTGFCGAILLAYFWGDIKPQESNYASALFFALTLGQAASLLKKEQSTLRAATQFDEDVLNALIILLMLCSLIDPGWSQTFDYRGQKRWQGPWRSPNLSGLLMATGLVLALGQTFNELALKSKRSNNDFKTRLIWLSIYVAAVGLMTFRLCGSYSRGAWLGCLVGASYLGIWWWHGSHQTVTLTANDQRVKDNEICHRCFPFVVVAALSLFVLAFWNLRDSERPLLRRLFSWGNVNDFSWRNRLVTYEGAMQMMATKPMRGFGWGEFVELYEASFKPSKLDNGRAIGLNDFFLIGITLGIPALGCFIGYVWLSLLSGPEARRRKTDRAGPTLREHSVGNWLKVPCHAGVMVLLVGFWFHGGLFHFSSTTLFWILLELGYQTDTRFGTGSV